MEYLLSGVVELDDTYFGSTEEGGKRGRGTSKAKIVVAVSKDRKGKPQYLKMQAVGNLKGETIGAFAESLLGTYHGNCRINLQAFLDEFCYRFNRRWHKDELFTRLLNAVSNSYILCPAELSR